MAAKELKAPTFLPQGYKQSSVTTRERTKHTFVDRTEHFDGSVDATVHIKALKLSLTTDTEPNHAHVAAIAELEAATKEHRLAKHSNVEAWVAYTTRRLHDANVRLLEVQ